VNTPEATSGGQGARQKLEKRSDDAKRRGVFMGSIGEERFVLSKSLLDKISQADSISHDIVKILGVPPEPRSEEKQVIKLDCVGDRLEEANGGMDSLLKSLGQILEYCRGL
jgi:hypothetical protein